jgi:hypothetical protein
MEFEPAQVALKCPPPAPMIVTLDLTPSPAAGDKNLPCRYSPWAEDLAQTIESEVKQLALCRGSQLPGPGS